MSGRTRLSRRDVLAVGALAAAAGLACATAAYTLVRWQDTVRSIDAVRASLATLGVRERALDAEHARAGRLDDALQRLRQQGFVTDRARVQWVAAVRTAERTAGLDRVESQAISERAVELPPAHDADGTGLTEFLVRVRAPVPHEGRLLDFLDALDEAPAGIMSVQGCTLERQRAASTAAPPTRLQASCDIAWTTAAPPPEDGAR